MPDGSEAFAKLADVAIALGAAPLTKHEGLWRHDLPGGWSVAVNGHDDVVEGVQPFHARLGYNGLAGRDHQPLWRNHRRGRSRERGHLYRGPGRGAGASEGSAVKPHVIYIRPWRGSGAVKWLFVALSDGTMETVYADPREMGIETLALFPHFLSMYNAVLAEVQAGRHKAKKPKAAKGRA